MAEALESLCSTRCMMLFSMGYKGIAKDLILGFLFLCSSLISKVCFGLPVWKRHLSQMITIQILIQETHKIIVYSMLKYLGRNLLIPETFFEMHQRNKIDWWRWGEHTCGKVCHEVSMDKKPIVESGW